MMRTEALSAVAGVIGTVTAQIIPDASQMEQMAKWPLTLIMAAVAVVSIYLMYRGNRENSRDRLEEAKMNAESIKSLATSISKTNELLAGRPCIRNHEND
jgi:phosphotransferase system  glucose/maltose/N-acetylglucosamine-specific IIC component